MSKLNQCGLKAQQPHSPGQRPGCWVYMLNSAPCKGNSLIIRLLPLQGVGLVWRIFTQGVALGYVLLPLQGVLLTSFAPWRQPNFCVDLCNLWEALCCCGGKDTSATIFRTQTICVDLWNLWEAIPSRSFCEFCAICGRIFRSLTICVNLCNLWEDYCLLGWGRVKTPNINNKNPLAELI